MEKQLKCVLLLSLKEMALRKVAVLLWSDPDVLAFISRFRFEYSGMLNGYRKEWRETLEPVIKDKVTKLGLPESLAKEMIDFVKPISLEIMRWKEHYEARNHYVEIGLPGSSKLCWTTVGRIDDRRTAEELVRCEEMSVVQRYEIACFYCLEDSIPLLWEELPEEEKDYYLNEKAISLNLQFHWPRILKGGHSHLDYLLILEDRNLTFNQWAFEQSARKGYKSAAEHFFQKLTHEEREASLMLSAKDLLARIDFVMVDDERTCDFMCYLLNLMTPEKQMEFIKERPISILMIFLHWPLQDLFSENASLMWTFIPPSGYDELLSRMAEIFQQSEHCFPKLFQKFFIQSPPAFKKDFVYRGYAQDFLTIFIDFEDSESLEVIFRNVDAADRVELVCHLDTLLLFHEEILMGRWRMVEVCLREAMLSEVDRKRLKKGFFRDCRLNWEDPVFTRLLEFLKVRVQIRKRKLRSVRCSRRRRENFA